ncbi:peptidoglycan DD-metalloendopeptidase family protein [uncultured Oceanisphaera sp.]|uniref:peptidoglycan DD-metalloendopeptidase family protein n=1 Tax=uncultured Oceanisphaera sp. TaxID=353858 RepID=UPI00262910DE|nr:peptidoglycan DD-metalloendopeptidase family protein [uncultured Oceanisphaera sp.]
MPVIYRLKTLPRVHKIALGLLSTAMVALIMMPTEPAVASRVHADLAVPAKFQDARQPLEIEVQDLPLVDEHLPARELMVKVSRGDTLSSIFARQGLPSVLLHDINRLGADARSLQKIHPGDKLTFSFDKKGQFFGLSYPLDAARTLDIRQSESGLRSRIISVQLEHRTQYAQASVNSNFWNAGVTAGLSAGQIMSLAAMFAWDLDFGLDIRAGDRFAVLYDQRYKDGILVDTGHILAAEFINQGNVYRAIRHDDGNYYSPEGRAMRKSFLRAPVNFSHISSNFNPRRLHPVTGQVKPHRGIDYAARTGTPVVAAGSGVVVESGYSRFNGNYVVIRHDRTYLTKYLHLNKRMVKKGEKVKQEQQIGTVGATGRVTGPHLHYEFLVNGVHKDPKSVDLPQAAFLSRGELAKFRPRADKLMAQLSKVSEVMLANN